MVELNGKVESETADQKAKELRAYGYPLAAGVVITKKPTPEFQCKYNNQYFVIEVISKQMNNEEEKSLGNFH